VIFIMQCSIPLRAAKLTNSCQILLSINSSGNFFI
jgi:hypothetical protein